MADNYEINTVIIGGGISGLLMGYVLKEYDYTILEQASESSIITGAPFYLHKPIDWLPTKWKRIEVHKNCWDGKWFVRTPNIGHMNDYARKITGKIHDTSLKFMDGGIEEGYLPVGGNSSRVIKDLLDANERHVQYSCRVTEILPAKKVIKLNKEDKEYTIHYSNLISTIPLPVLLRMLNLEIDFTFKADPILTSAYKVTENEAVDAYQIIYVTTPKLKPYRVSLMHNTIFVEAMVPMDEDENRNLIKMVWGFENPKHIETKSVSPGKFHPIERNKRKILLARLTSDYGIYCIGRYAVWAYKRLDHLADDAMELVKIIRDNSSNILRSGTANV